jgi:predicted ferric reductase
VLKWGINWYDNWLYAASAVWFFDRLLRVGRITKNGIQRATVTDVGTDHVRIDVKGVRWVSKPGYVAYAYFPTLNKLRPWENHPFSINSTTIFHNGEEKSLTPSIERSSSASSSQIASNSEKGPRQTVQSSITPHPVVGLQSTSGITLIVKKNSGLTRLLGNNSDLLTLIDGPYPQHPSSEILECDHILLLGGGIGITGLLAWAHAHPNVKLAWSVKEHHGALVKEVETAFAHVQEKEVVIGSRLNLDELLRAAAEKGYKKVGVVVCGPPGMCDDVRSKVSGIARGGETTFRLEVEAFSW